jgi:hypothetical protein
VARDYPLELLLRAIEVAVPHENLVALQELAGRRVEPVLVAAGGVQRRSDLGGGPRGLGAEDLGEHALEVGRRVCGVEADDLLESLDGLVICRPPELRLALEVGAHGAEPLRQRLIPSGPRAGHPLGKGLGDDARNQGVQAVERARRCGAAQQPVRVGLPDLNLQPQVSRRRHLGGAP